jgi:hypothetical protein
MPSVRFVEDLKGRDLFVSSRTGTLTYGRRKLLSYIGRKLALDPVRKLASKHGAADRKWKGCACSAEGSGYGKHAGPGNIRSVFARQLLAKAYGKDDAHGMAIGIYSDTLRMVRTELGKNVTVEVETIGDLAKSYKACREVTKASGVDDK